MINRSFLIVDWVTENLLFGCFAAKLLHKKKNSAEFAVDSLFAYFIEKVPNSVVFCARFSCLYISIQPISQRAGKRYTAL